MIFVASHNFFLAEDNDMLDSDTESDSPGESDNNSKKVIIIGAGISGLVAGY